MSWVLSSSWNTFLSRLPELYATLASPLPHWLLLLCPLHWHFLLCISKCWTVLILGPRSSQFSSVQSLSHVWLLATPWIIARQASLSITSSWSLPKPMSIESVMQSNHLILCRPLLLLPPVLPSIVVFSNESTLHMRWPKYWSFSFNISPSNEHPGLVSFRMTGWIFLQSKGLSRVFSITAVQKHQFFGAQLLYSPTLTSIHDYCPSMAPCYFQTNSNILLDCSFL